MATDNERLIQEVEDRLHHLMRLCRTQSDHLAELATEKARLEALVEAQQQQIRSLDQHLSMASVALQTTPQSLDRLRDFRAEVDALMDEVGVCIACLEKNV